MSKPPFYHWSDTPRLIALALVYSLLARLVLTFSTANGNVTIFWLPGGLALAALLLWGKRFWPAVFVGAFIAGLMVNDPFGVSAALAIGNTLETLTAAFLLQRSTDFDPALTKTSDFLKITLTAIVSTIISALIGPLTLLLNGYLTVDNLSASMLNWWQGDTLGIVLGAPCVLIWQKFPREWFARRRILATAGFFLLAVFSSQAIFLNALPDSAHQFARSYWMFLFVIWGARQYGRQGALLIIAITAIQGLRGAALGMGAFGTDIADTGLQNFWFYLLILTLTGISLAISIDNLKQAGQALHEKEANLRAFFDNSPIGINVFDVNGKVLSVNAAARQMFGVALEDTLAHYNLFDDPAILAETKSALRQGLIATEERYIDFQQIYRHGMYATSRTPDDKIFISLTFTPCFAQQQLAGYIASIVDITERKSRENQIRLLNQAYAALAQTNRIARHAATETELFTTVCRIAVEVGGMKMAWVGIPEADSKLINPVACYGNNTDYLQGIEVSIDPNRPEGRGPAGTAMREGRVVVIQDFDSAESTQAWHDRSRKTGNWHACAVFPVYRAKQPYAVFTLYHADQNAFDALIVSLLSDMSADIGFALDVLDTEASRNRAMQALSQSEKRFHRISSLTSDLFYSCRRSPGGLLRIEWIGGNSEQLFGYDLDELKRRNCWDCFVVADDRPLFTRHITALQPGHSSEVVLRITHRDGSLRYLNSYAYVEHAQSIAGDFQLYGAVQDVTEHKMAEYALQKSEERYRALSDLLPDQIWTARADGQVDYVNQRVIDFFHRPMETLTGDNWHDVVHAEDLPHAIARWSASIHSGQPYQMELRLRHHSGEYRWFSARALPTHDEQGDIKQWYGINTDITARKQNEEKLRLTNRVFESTLEGILITDADAHIIDVNKAFTQITGYGREEALGKTPRILKSGHQDASFYVSMWQTITNTGHWSGEIWNRRKDGEVYPEWITISAIIDDQGETTHYVGISSDITLLKQHEKQLEHIAHYDALTGIPNRVLLVDRMQQALAQTRREQKLLAICYLDLDGFKPINDSQGHEAGDSVLIKIAERIGHSLRGGDTVARLGGDEFVILLLGIENTNDCHTSLDRLLRAIEQPIMIKGLPFRVTASIGVTLYPTDDEEPDTLLRHADQAMYIAKQSGKNRYHIFDPHQDARIRVNRELRTRIEQGLLGQEFELYYQPKVDMVNHQLVGAEALIRWRHPQRGLLSPLEFLPIIENSELEIQLGEWVIDTTLNQLECWHREGLALEVSINIAAAHLQSAGFIDSLKQKLSQHPILPANRLQIEILETAALADISSVSEIMEACSAIGVRFALDDFGTGYSSLAYLRRLPADTLKIDQSFVRDMLTDKGDYAIVQGIIALAQTFNRTTVAEGVETRTHFETLKAMGCNVGQGYGIARPMPAEALMAWHKTSFAERASGIDDTPPTL